MKNNKQSSVEWLVEQFESCKVFSIKDVLEQAKAMHKEEIEDAYTSDSILRTPSRAEHYYNETFNTNEK